MYRPFLILLVCQLLGELIARAAALPVPGPVLGLAFLLAALLARGGPDDSLAGVANGLLQHLSLLFVPAAVGLVQHLPRLEREALPIVVALVVSTALTIAVAALVFRLAARAIGDDPPEAAP